MSSASHQSRFVPSNGALQIRHMLVENGGWLLLFAAATYIAAQPELTPTVPGTELRLIWFPFAFLCIAFLLRPRGEAPFYALIYAAVSLISEQGLGHPGFAVARIGIEVIQAAALVFLFHNRYRHFLNYPLLVVFYLLGALAIAGLGALATLAAATMAANPTVYSNEMAGRPALALRHWWLGNACAFLTVAGPAVYLFMLRRRLVEELRHAPRESRIFGALSASLFLAALFLLPVYDVGWLHVPADVHLALMMVPAPIAFAMAARFRGLGTSTAMLILTPLAMISAAGPHAGAHWSGLPPMATPLHLFLIITTVGCNVISAITYRLHKAVEDALAAGQAKSRFVAMLNHELRTPLNAILGFSELIRLQKLRAMDEAVGPIENIHASGQRLLAMIEGLLSQADHGAGVFEIHRQQLNLFEEVSTAVAEVRNQFKARGARLECRSDEHLLVDADPNALRQVLTVILSRAARNSKRGTDFAVTAKRVGTNTVVDFRGSGMRPIDQNPEDRIERQLVTALVLAHGARLTLRESSPTSRVTRLTFFATHAAG